MFFQVLKHLKTDEYSETSVKRTPSGPFQVSQLNGGCKNCAMIVNDQQSAVNLYCDKSCMLLKKLSRVQVHYLSLPTLIFSLMQN